MVEYTATLLIISDRVNTEDYQSLLQDTEVTYRIIGESSEEEIVSLCRSHQINLGILEVNAAKSSSLQVLERIKSQLGEGCPPIIAVGIDDAEIAVRAIKLGAADYLVRERITSEKLLHSLETAIANNNNSQQHLAAQIETERKQTEVALAADLENTRLLHDLSTRLVIENNIQVLYDQILATAIAITRADAGTVQILEEETQDLLLLASQGFERTMTEHFYRVNASSNTPCGKALTTGDRTFSDFDVPENQEPDGSLRMHLKAGYLSAQSTPLISRSGQPIGMFSTHWRKHHRPTERELQFLDLLARQAADLIEQQQIQTDLRESEAILQKAFSIETVGVLFFKLDGGITDANEAFVQMSGYSRDELVNTVKWEVLTPPEFMEVTTRTAEELANRGETAPYEKQMIRKDGSRWWGLFAPTRLTGSGSESECVEFIIDISDRKRSEKQLRRAAERDAYLVKLNDALRSLADPVQIQAEACHLLGKHLGVDRAYYVETDLVENCARVARDYLRGDSPSLVGVYPFEDYGWTVPYLQRGETVVVADTETEEIIPEAERQAMAAIGIRSHISLPLIKAGTLVGALCVTERIPHQWSATEIELVRETAERIWATIERARAEAALQESEIQRVREQSAREQERERAEALAELDRVKITFFSNISHEFRTPLTLLLAPLQDALEAPLPEPQRERLELARRNSLRLLKLVNSLLDFSRMEAGRLQVNYELTDLATYTVELTSTFRSAIEHGGLQLVVDCPPLPEAIYVDRQMWSKIVLNLLSNAFKFTFGGIITVSLKLKTNTVELTVSDTGMGISAEELPHIFERFYQSKVTKGRSYEGSGIGLSLVQELVKLHGGDIEVDSEVDRGTTFKVTLPTGSAHLPTEHLENAPTPTPTSFVLEAEHWLTEASAVPSQNSESNTARILIVDDNADLRNYLQRLLSEYYQVETTNDGLAALTTIRQATQSYDLVLTDIMMPNLDGLELLRSLRADANTREIPIILLSARAGEESVVEGLIAGADDYLIKPFSPRELLARVNTHLQLVRMRREATYRQQIMAEMQKLNETLEEQVKERTARLEEVNRELEAFSHSVSHDLQTPLNYIASFAQRLKTQLNSTQLEKTSQEYLNIILEATEQCRSMVHNLLEFSRLGQTPLHRTSVSMDSLVQQVREQLTPALVGRSLDWQIEPLPTVQGDLNLLRLVLQNLLSNAVKYTRDRPIGKITIGSRDRRGEIVFFVRDNGVGFDMKYYERLFAFFQRLHTQEEFVGTGIGLAQAKRIVHRHGGRIWATGAVECGATFYFSLPKQETLS